MLIVDLFAAGDIGHFIDLLVQQALVKLVGIVCHETLLYLADFIEAVCRAWFLVQGILFENLLFASGC